MGRQVIRLNWKTRLKARLKAFADEKETTVLDAEWQEAADAEWREQREQELVDISFDLMEQVEDAADFADTSFWQMIWQVCKRRFWIENDRF